MSEKPTKIQRYAFVRSGKFRSVENRPDGDLMLYADHEADVAAQVAEAVEKERERCRREEVEPLWRACGAVFLSVHSLTQILGLTPPQFEARVNKVLIATDAMIRTRADVGKVQSENPLVTVEAAQQQAEGGKETQKA